MNIAAVDRTIHLLCAEVKGSDQDIRGWEQRSEEDLLYEVCVCMFSSQMVFEVAEAAARKIKKRVLLRETKFEGHEQHLMEVLSEPLSVELCGKVRNVRPRFKNRLASLLSTTITSMREHGQTLRTILLSADSAREARERLIEQVCGFGPKQTSLFLRRVGYCSELAVLDTHVLDYLRVARGINPKPSALSRLTSYELIETEFQKIAAEFGYSVGCVDLAMWVTMRVAKREAVW